MYKAISTLGVIGSVKNEARDSRETKPFRRIAADLIISEMILNMQNDSDALGRRVHLLTENESPPLQVISLSRKTWK